MPSSTTGRGRRSRTRGTFAGVDGLGPRREPEPHPGAGPRRRVGAVDDLDVLGQRGDQLQAPPAEPAVGRRRSPGAGVGDLDVDAAVGRPHDPVLARAGAATRVGVLDRVGQGLAEGQLEVLDGVDAQTRGGRPGRDGPARTGELSGVRRQPGLQRSGQQAGGDHGDVVGLVRVGQDVGEQPGGEPHRIGRRVPSGDLEDAGQSVVQQLAAPLDQSVGVQQQGGAGLDRDRALGERRPAGGAEDGAGARGLQEAALAVGRHQERRRVTRARPRHGAGGAVDDQTRGGGRERAREPGGEPVQQLEGRGWSQPCRSAVDRALRS